MATIDLSNYDSSTLGLVQSSESRTGTPDGNIFFDVANGRIELITAEELANVDMTDRGGGASVANPLSQQDGVKMEALYAFEREQRRLDETLRQYDYFFEGTFKFGGAYKLVNGRVFDDVDGTDTGLADNTAGESDDRVKVRGSGWSEEQSGGVARIYYGVGSLGNIEDTSQPYYILGSDSPVDFAKDGSINEAIQVLGNAVLDTNTTTFDKTSALSNRIRTFGYNYDEKVLADSGVSEMAGYFSGFALGESAHLTTGNYTLADVYGGSQASPWTGMTLEKLATAQTESGFNEADGDFTWVVNNTVPGSLDQVVAFLDALSQTEDDIDSGTETVTNGKVAGTWYSYNATGQVVTDAPFSSEGLFIENLPTADQQSVVFTDDAGATKTYPFNAGIQVTVGANAVADANAWYHAFFLDGPASNDFNTANALTVEDNTSAEVKGNVATDESSNRIDFTFDYDGDTIGGTAGTNKDVVFECEGDGGVTAAKTVFTISRAATIAVTCQPSVETNV